MRRPAPVNQARGDAAPKEKNNEKNQIWRDRLRKHRQRIPSARAAARGGRALVWACDLIEERAQKAKDDFGFEKYTLVITTS